MTDPLADVRAIATVNDFAGWLAGAKAGDCFEYYRGNLARDLDRLKTMYRLDKRNTTLRDRHSALAELRELVYNARGKVILSQRRIGDERFSYMATRRMPERHIAGRPS